MITTTVPCPACQHLVHVRLEARADDRLTVEPRHAEPVASGAPGWRDTLAVFDLAGTGLAAVRHWLFGVLALLAWSTAGHALVGIAVVGGLGLLAVGALRVLVPSTPSDAGDGARARARLRPGLLTAAFAFSSAVGVLSAGPGWWVLGAMLLVAGAAVELRDVAHALRPAR